tara:strand:+ start:49 stop:681 length:633 start_codon:yes stop_codon:yes gene_type:complete
MKKVCVLDYGIGNVKSLCNALSNFNIDIILTSKHNDILSSDYLILPGVGAFKNAMDKLKALELDYIINQFVKSGKPFLGICVGMQVLFEDSEEFGFSHGLGLIKGHVKKIKSHKPNVKLPSIGWSKLVLKNNERWNNSILEKINKNDFVYFIHSFSCNPKFQKEILANTIYKGVELCASIQKDNITGVQFHPEKSGPVGLKILNQFVKSK